MGHKKWNVNIKSRDDNTSIITIEWPDKPTFEQAAIRSRESLIGKNFLLVDTPRNHPEPTVFLLKSYGFEITSIDEFIEEA